MRNYLKLLQFMGDHKPLFCMAVMVMFVASFFEVFQMSLLVPLVDIVFVKKKIIVPEEVPEFLDRIVAHVNTLDPMTLFPIILGGFLAILLVKNSLVFFYQLLMGDVSQRIMRDIRSQLYDKIQNLSLDYFSKKRTGELVSRITHDVNFVENAVSYALTDMFRQTFVIIFFISIAFTILPKAALVLFLVGPVIGVPMSKIGRRLKKISKGIQEKMADINAHLLETISGVTLVKAFCAEKYEIDRFRGQNNAYYKLRMRSIKRLILISPLTEIIGGCCGIGMMWWFGQKMQSEEISFGIFGIFFASIISTISPIKKLGNVNAITQQALSANQRIYDVLDAEIMVKEKSGATTVGELANSIEMKDVDFRYDADDTMVLQGINLSIKKGELVAIVGPTGSGKTTLANLIPRFYDPGRGSVTIDGVNLKEASFPSLRLQIGIVTQETILFNDTVRANIAYSHPEASQARIEEAAKRAFAHRFIEKMPKGYDTLIGDRGFRLSGGEKQRIAIARAILKNPAILILDEATSALDSESEKYVQEALDKLMHGRTVVAIAHRLSTIQKADRILVLEQGRIVGSGRHEELLKTSELYKRLHSMQFQV